MFKNSAQHLSYPTEAFRVKLKAVMRTICLLSLFILALCAPPEASAASGPCDLTQSMLPIVSSIRGLPSKAPVPCVVASREEIKGFLLETIKTKLPPQKVRMEEQVYKALGVIPEDFDYEKGIVALYVSQIGGYYDPEKKHFVMADWISHGLQEDVVSHELTHALQDQYFNLEVFLDPMTENGDALLAHAALVEGDAMLVMHDHIRHKRKERSLHEERDPQALFPKQLSEPQANSSTSDFPKALQEIVLFPYIEGVRFAHELLKRPAGYKELDAAYGQPPESTRMILHPEVYMNPTAAQADIPDLKSLKSELAGASPVYTDILGELTIKATLCARETDRENCRAAAAGLLGDRVAIFTGTGRQREVVWLSRWESPKDAAEFADTFKKIVAEGDQQMLPDNTILHVTSGKALKIQRIGSSVRVGVVMSQSS